MTRCATCGSKKPAPGTNAAAKAAYYVMRIAGTLPPWPKLPQSLAMLYCADCGMRKKEPKN